MKKIIRYTTLSLLLPLLMVSGCSRFLEVEQLGKTTMPIFFSDMDGIRAGMAGAYAGMYNYYSSHFYTYPEMAGDMVSLDLNVASEGQKNVYNFAATPDDEAGPVGKIWSDIYEALANINNILFYLPELQDKFPQNQRELQTDRAEALFLRALCHFDLSRVYAQPYNYTADASHIGVPILKRTPGPDDNVTRKPLREVYDFIIADLEEADKLFDGAEIKAPYYASRLAVRALLSRVYLYKGDWDNAIKYATMVIDQKPLAQGEAYVQMFKQLSSSEAETLFRLHGLDKSSSLLGFYNMVPQVKNGVLTGYTLPIATPSDKYLKLYEKGGDTRMEDMRYDALVDRVSLVGGIYYATAKFNVPQSSSAAEKQYYSPFVLRVSEMYLNRAEAYLQKNQLVQAAQDIKTLVARAFQKEANEVSLEYTGRDGLATIIDDERAKELAFEGHRFFDIVRRKQNVERDAQTNSEVQRITYPNDRFVLPISQKELDANRNMDGNPTVNPNVTR